MSKKLYKIISFILCFLLIFEQSGFAQVAGELDISAHFSRLASSFAQDKFRPLHLRYLSYDNLNNNFNLLLDKGDFMKGLSPKGTDPEDKFKDETRILLNYFFVGISLPNDTFWVNLRPDSPEQIIDDTLAETDVGKILLEADLQLKKDTAKFTSPETPQGKDYWDKLYQKAGELFGSDNITIPTLTRPWIVPDEIIIRESTDNAYIYKATLKVMLEQDYLKDSTVYNFKDERLKELNEYSSQLIRELIIPKLIKDVNTAKRYAPLRQVYYSLIMAQWFKSRFYGKGGLYSWLIDKKNLNGITSKENWSQSTYFKAYQQSFKDGEYNIKTPVSTPLGQTIRSYFSGGIALQGIFGEGNSRLLPATSSASPIVQAGSSTILWGGFRKFLDRIGRKRKDIEAEVAVTQPDTYRPYENIAIKIEETPATGSSAIKQPGASAVTEKIDEGRRNFLKGALSATAAIVTFDINALGKDASAETASEDKISREEYKKQRKEIEEFVVGQLSTEVQDAYKKGDISKARGLLIKKAKEDRFDFREKEGEKIYIVPIKGFKKKSSVTVSFNIFDSRLVFIDDSPVYRKEIEGIIDKRINDRLKDQRDISKLLKGAGGFAVLLFGSWLSYTKLVKPFLDRRTMQMLEQAALDIEGLTFTEDSLKIKAGNIEIWLSSREIEVFRKNHRIAKIARGWRDEEIESYILKKNIILRMVSDYISVVKDKDSHLRLLEFQLQDTNNKADIDKLVTSLRQVSNVDFEVLSEIERLLIKENIVSIPDLLVWLNIANSKNQDLNSGLKDLRYLLQVLQGKDKYIISAAIHLLNKNREITLQKFSEWVNTVKPQNVYDLIMDLERYYTETTLLLGAGEYEKGRAYFVNDFLSKNKKVEFSSLLEWLRTAKKYGKEEKYFFESIDYIYKNTREWLAKEGEKFSAEEGSLLEETFIKEGGKLLLALWDIPEAEYLNNLLELSNKDLFFGKEYAYTVPILSILRKNVTLLDVDKIIKAADRGYAFGQDLIQDRIEKDPSLIPLVIDKIKIADSADSSRKSIFADILVKSKNTDEILQAIIDKNVAQFTGEENDTLFHWVINLTLARSRNEERIKQLIEKYPDIFGKLFKYAIEGKLGLEIINSALKNSSQIKISAEEFMGFLTSPKTNYILSEERKNFINLSLLKDKNLFSALLLYYEGTDFTQTWPLESIFAYSELPAEWRQEFSREFFNKLIGFDSQKKNNLTSVIRLALGQYFINNASPEDIRFLVKATSLNILTDYFEGNPQKFLDNLEPTLTVFNEEIVSYARQIEETFKLLNNPSFLIRSLLNKSLNSVLNETKGDLLKAIKSQPGLTNKFIYYLAQNPQIFLDKLEPILEVLNPMMLPYVKNIRALEASTRYPSFLVSPIINKELNDILIKTDGNLLEAIKSESNLTDKFIAHLASNSQVLNENLEKIINVFNPEIIPYTESIKAAYSLTGSSNIGTFLGHYIVNSGSFEKKIGEIFITESLDYQKKMSDFIKKEQQDINEVFEYLNSNGVNPSLSFLKKFFAKADTSFLDIILTAKKDKVFSKDSDLTMLSNINMLLNSQNRYEAVTEALNIIIETKLIIRGASLEGKEADKEINLILENYLKENIGNKKFIGELERVNLTVKTQAFNKIINRQLNESEKEFLEKERENFDPFLGNLIGLYFRIRNSEDEVCKKVSLSMERLLELKDINKFNSWLYQEAGWNKDTYQELISAGYNPLFWEQGVRKTLPLDDTFNNAAEEMAKQTEQLIELAGKYNIKVEHSYKEKGMVSYEEAEIFAKKYFLEDEAIEQKVKDLVKAILEDTKKLELVYKNKIITSNKVTIEIIKDFLKDTYAGVGVPGCFAPRNSHNEMPVIHALETNSLFLRIYNENNKMIANAVLVLTPQGMVVQPLYNATNLSLGKVVLSGLAELLLREYLPNGIPILFTDSSAGKTEALKYAEKNKISAVKKNNLGSDIYFDFSNGSSREKTEFSMAYYINRELLLVKGYKAFEMSAIEEEINNKKEDNRKISKEERKQITQELFSLEITKDLNLNPVLKSIEKIIFEFNDDKIEEILSSLKTRAPPQRNITLEEKKVLKNKILEIKNRITQTTDNFQTIAVREPELVSSLPINVPAAGSPVEELEDDKGFLFLKKLAELLGQLRVMLNDLDNSVVIEEDKFKAAVMGAKEAAALIRNRENPNINPLLWALARLDTAKGFDIDVSNKLSPLIMGWQLGFSEGINGSETRFNIKTGLDSVVKAEEILKAVVDAGRFPLIVIVDEAGHSREIADLPSLKAKISQDTNGSSGSPIEGVSSAVEVDRKGGIDLRALPIVTQPMNMPALKGASPISFRDSPLRGQSLNLDNEWREIQNMLNAGIIPSSERIKEYLQSCCQREDISQEIDKVLACLVDILRLEEERVSLTEPELKEILVLLESDKPANEMQVALAKITVAPKEPRLVGP